MLGYIFFVTEAPSCKNISSVSSTRSLGICGSISLHPKNTGVLSSYPE